MYITNEYMFKNITMQFNSYIFHAKHVKIKHYEIITLKKYKFYITFCLFNDKNVIPLIQILQIKT